MLLDPVGDERLPNYQNLDFHVERPVQVRDVAVHPVARRVQHDQLNTIQAIRSRAERVEREPAFRRSSRRASCGSASGSTGRLTRRASRSAFDLTLIQGGADGPAFFLRVRAILSFVIAPQLVHSFAQTPRSAPIPIWRSPR